MQYSSQATTLDALRNDIVALIEDRKATIKSRVVTTNKMRELLAIEQTVNALSTLAKNIKAMALITDPKPLLERDLNGRPKGSTWTYSQLVTSTYGYLLAVMARVDNTQPFANVSLKKHDINAWLIANAQSCVKVMERGTIQVPFE